VKKNEGKGGGKEMKGVEGPRVASMERGWDLKGVRTEEDKVSGGRKRTNWQKERGGTGEGREGEGMENGEEYCVMRVRGSTALFVVGFNMMS